MSMLGLMAGRGPQGVPPAAPLDFAQLVLPPSPNAWLAAPPGTNAAAQEQVPLLPVAPDAAWDALRRLGDGMPRVWKTAEWPALRQAQWVARTPVMNFPDIVAAQVVEMPGGAGLFLYSRSLVGYSDFGVNRRRVAEWRAAFARLLGTAR